MTINATGVYYRQLNEQIRAAFNNGADEVVVENVCGHRYLGTSLRSGRIVINGVPGNDLGAFMDGAEIIVRGNAQDGVGNTMNAGKIVIHGHAGDILGYAQRGGKIFVQDSVGYRAGIHMKAYHDHFPVVVVGGTAQDYLGEYMAGGILAVLNLNSGDQLAAGDYIGTGMHGGVIYLRGTVEAYQLGQEVGLECLEESDWQSLGSILGEYCTEFDRDPAQFCQGDFVKLTPRSTRPYGRLYVY